MLQNIFEYRGTSGDPINYRRWVSNFETGSN